MKKQSLVLLLAMLFIASCGEKEGEGGTPALLEEDQAKTAMNDNGNALLDELDAADNSIEQDIFIPSESVQAELDIESLSNIDVDNITSIKDYYTKVSGTYAWQNDDRWTKSDGEGMTVTYINKKGENVEVSSTAQFEDISNSDVYGELLDGNALPEDVNIADFPTNIQATYKVAGQTEISVSKNINIENDKFSGVATLVTFGEYSFSYNFSFGGTYSYNFSESGNKTTYEGSLNNGNVSSEAVLKKGDKVIAKATQAAAIILVDMVQEITDMGRVVGWNNQKDGENRGTLSNFTNTWYNYHYDWVNSFYDYDTDTYYEYYDEEKIVQDIRWQPGNVSGLLQILDVEYKVEIDGEKAYNEVKDDDINALEANEDKYIDLLNKYVRITVTNTVDNQQLATMVFQRGGEYNELMPFLKFKDDQLVDPEVYFNAGFDNLTNRLEDWIADMESSLE